MKFIIDKDYIRRNLDPANRSCLEKYLCSDIFMMESVKGKDLVLSLRKTFENVRRYPERIVIMKSLTSIVAENSAGRPCDPVSLIDWTQTKRIRQFFRIIYSGRPEGEIKKILNLEYNTLQTANYLDMILLNVNKLRSETAEISRVFSKREIDDLLVNAKADSDFVTRFCEHSLRIYFTVAGHTNTDKVDYAELKDYFFFRFSIALLTLMLIWIKYEQHKSLTDVDLQHDIFDLINVTLGTFYDGVLAIDTKLNLLSRTVRILV